MNTYLDDKSSAEVPGSLSGSIRRRIMALVFCSTLTVALAFGLTFYYALVSNQSAVAQQIPELAAVVEKLKNLLIVNTLVFVAIIIGSFFILARIITSRMFEPLGDLHRNLTALANGKLPRSIEPSGESAFSGLEDAMKTALAVIRDRERAELEKLAQGRESLAAGPGPQQARKAIEEIIASKSAFLGMSEKESTAKSKEKKARDLPEDSLFLKPR